MTGAEGVREGEDRSHGNLLSLQGLKDFSLYLGYRKPLGDFLNAVIYALASSLANALRTDFRGKSTRKPVGML